VKTKNLYLSMLAAASVAGAADSTLVAGFDLRTNQNLIDGFWFYLDDSGSKGDSKVTSADNTQSPPIFGDSSFADDATKIMGASARLAYTFGSHRPECQPAPCTYSPEVTMGTNIVPAGATARDITGATAIGFWAKATPPVKVSIIGISTDVTDYSWPRAEVAVTSEWKYYHANLTGTTAPVFLGTWGSMNKKNPTLSKMQGFSFALQKDTNPAVTSGELLIDDLYLIGIKDQNSAIRPGSGRSLARALSASAGAGALKVSLPDAYRNAAGTVAALDLAGRTVASAAFAKGQADVSLEMPARHGQVFLRVFPAGM
jgi:hypothetical protein